MAGLRHSGISEQNPPPSPPPAPGSSGGRGSGGGGGGGGAGAFYVCNQEWQCGEWSACNNGAQSRECNLVKVPQHTQQTVCPSISNPPSTGRKCESKTGNETTTKPISLINFTKTENDESALDLSSNPSGNSLTGAVTGNGIMDRLLANPKAMREIKIWSAAIILIAAATGGFIYYNRRKKS